MWNHSDAHPGEFIRARFLEPLGLSASALAAGCRIPRSRVSDILAGRRAITVDTAMRLGAFFRMEPEQWMALQAAWEIGRTDLDEDIVPLDPPGFLLGPMGATPIPHRRPDRPKLLVPSDHTPQFAAEPHPTRRRVHEEVRYPDGTRALVSKPE